MEPRDHTPEGFCACDACLKVFARARWATLSPAERESERFRRFMSRELYHVREAAADLWQQGRDAGELDEEDLEAIRRYLIGRVVRAGGRVHALAELHRALRRAAADAESIGPELVHDDPELCVEWYESEGGYAVAGGYVVNSEGYEVLEQWYEQAWTDALADLWRRSVEGDLTGAGAPDPVARLVEFLLDLERKRADYPTTAPPELTYRPFHRPDLGPIVRTGPPAGTWASLPQVLPAAA
ncbi:MAG: hypothetical protein R2720_03435 [Candidatus Nanopelagicales bacterium]